MAHYKPSSFSSNLSHCLQPKKVISKQTQKLKMLANNRNITLLVLLATLLPIIAISHETTINKTPHNIINSTCSSTLYSELCISSLMSSSLSPKSNITTFMGVVKAALDHTIATIKLNKVTIKKITLKKSLTVREKTALKDCLETADDSLDELKRVELKLQNYPSKNYSPDDVLILLSAAMTNQETCIDGFSHDKADRKTRSAFLNEQLHAFRLCSNVLAMIKNMSNANVDKIGGEHYSNNNNNNAGHEWPKWLSGGDRRLLQATTVTPDTIVAADGTGNHLTVTAAVAAAPSGGSRRYIIRIKAGTYRENVEVARGKSNIMFMGDGRTTTIITGSRNVVDGSTTFNSATVAIIGDRFLARDITFQNTAGPSKHQAVALRVNADFAAFYRCDMIAYQDTLYVHSLRQFYVSCYVAGTVDFIFGNAAVVLQNCDIHARRPNPGQRNMVTAQGRDDPNENTGIVIQKCRIGATSDLRGQESAFPTYLGRPWKRYSRTIIMQSEISNVINPAGWFEWSGTYALATLFYAEYSNTGAGAGTANRVKWGGYRVITSATGAQPFTAGNFISGGNWLASTGFPFSLGL